MNKITVTIITLNEERNIERAIESAKKVADEIIVVDSKSIDNTAELAKKLGARVYTREFDNYANQKNFAADKSINEWIFSLDADEEISDDLAEEIKSAVDRDFDAYLIPRKNIILGNEIKHSRWSPDKHIWLWKKKKGKWEGKVHEELVASGKVSELKNSKVHYQDENVFDFVESMNKYTEIEAIQRYKKGNHFSVFRLILDPLRSFIGRYFYKSGYKDGWRGLALCLLRAIYYALIWIKVLELQKKKQR